MSKLTIRTFHVFDAPAANVWALLADFGAIERWWPTEGSIVIDSVQLEGQGVGMVRHIFNRGAPQGVSERLERLDSGERVLQLSILGRDSVRTPWYLATARLVELQNDRCRLDYESEFSAPPGRENQTRDGILAAYRAMFSGLQNAAK
ncbi:MAG: SRPBCC family protein [Steroidobacteraceae bacterium]